MPYETALANSVLCLTVKTIKRSCINGKIASALNTRYYTKTAHVCSLIHCIQFLVATSYGYCGLKPSIERNLIHLLKQR